MSFASFLKDVTNVISLGAQKRIEEQQKALEARNIAIRETALAAQANQQQADQLQTANSKTLTYVIAGIVVVIILLLVVFFIKKKK